MRSKNKQRLHYQKLEIQEYFTNGNCNKKNGKNNIQSKVKHIGYKRSKYADLICIGCKLLEKSGDEIMLCEVLNNENKISECPVTYDLFSVKISVT